MPLFKNIHKYNSKICLIDKHGKNYLYRDIIKKSEFLASKISTKKLIFFLEATIFFDAYPRTKAVYWRASSLLAGIQVNSECDR